MKRSLLALAALTAISGVAYAQSSVTLSGRVDAGMVRSAGQWSMGGSQSGYNAFTLSGTEDLGGGMRAFFLMNHRFSIQNGTNNSGGNASTLGGGNFWRNSWVGLGGGFGDVRMGRILMPLQDVNGGYDAFDTGTVGSVHVNGLFNVATVRANSAIYYRTPAMGGLFVHAAIAAGEGQLNSGATSERPMGFAAGYAAGPLSVAFATDRSAANLDTVGLYGKYKFGAMTLMGQYEKADQTATLSTKGYSFSAVVPVGVGRILAGYARIDPSGTGVTRRTHSKFGIGGEYNLSKRTLIYSDIGKRSGSGLTSAQTSAMFDLGVRHAF